MAHRCRSLYESSPSRANPHRTYGVLPERDRKTAGHWMLLGGPSLGSTGVFMIEWLIDIHYRFFMAKRDFWYDKELQEQDKRLCVLISNMRHVLLHTRT